MAGEREANGASGVVIKEATPADAALWDGIVSAAGVPPTGLFAWKQALARAYRIDSAFLMAGPEGESPTGVLPLYWTRSPRRVLRMWSLRYGLVADSAAVADALVARAQGMAAELGAADLLISSGYDPAGTAEPIRRKTVMLRFPTDEEAAWAAMKGKSRNLVRKAEQAGVVLSWDPEDLGRFQRLHSTAMAAKGIPAPSLGYLRAVQAALGDRMGVVLASIDGEPVAGTVVLFGNDVALYPYQATLGAGQKMAANQLMIWGIVKKCVGRGVGAIDMGESREGSPAFRFKTNFGGVPTDLHYYRPGRGAHGEAAAQPDGGHVTPRWSRLPGPLRRQASMWLHRRGRSA